VGAGAGARYPAFVQRTALVLAAAAALAAAPPAARADDPTPVAVTAGMQVQLARGVPVVARGGVSAPLPVPADNYDAVERATVDARTRRVAIAFSTCQGHRTVELGLDQLEARLANAAALAAHRRKDYAAAAAGFARAARLDPSFDLAATNHASALALAGKRDAAARALAPWLASNPTWTYGKVATDPELASLRRHPAVRRLCVRPRGTARLDAQGGLVGVVAYSAAKQQLAYVRREASWGACNFTTKLMVFDVATGQALASWTVVDWADSNPEACDKTDPETPPILPEAAARVRARAGRLVRVLRDLGFSAATHEVASIDDAGLHFAHAGLDLAVDAAHGTATLSRGGKVLGHATVPDRPQAGYYVPAARAVLVLSLRGGSEGCEGSDPTTATIVPVR
jgi:hypothetical protein